MVTILPAILQKMKVRIIERTSWSCPHGIRRWDEGCTCESGRHSGRSHEWRGPLRNAISALSRALSQIYYHETGKIFEDPWVARDGSIALIIDSSPKSIEKFFQDYAKKSADTGEFEKTLGLLEMTKQSLLMQTSCAWFFDDIADPEVYRSLKTLRGAIQIAREQTGVDLELVFRKQLSDIKGNRKQFPDGDVVYRECVLTRMIDAKKEAACLALNDMRKQVPSIHQSDAISEGSFACGAMYPKHDISIAGSPIYYCFISKGTDSVTLGLSFSGDDQVKKLTGIFSRSSGRKDMMQQ